MFRKIKEVLLVFVSFLSDFWFYIQCKGKKYKVDNYRKSILLLGHSLEKGLTFSEKKANWGEQKAMDLVRFAKQYFAICEDDELRNWTISVLANYQQDPFSSKSEALLLGISSLDEGASPVRMKTGVKEIRQPQFEDKDAIEHFFASRSSVRRFSTQEVTDSELSSSLKFTELSPSACNRQSCSVYAFRDREKITAILNNQLGDQGWCENAKMLLVVVSNQSSFSGVYERNQSYVDGGMYAMNLSYGLHLNGIASCFKMYISSPSIDKQFASLAGLKSNEKPIVLILCGHYPEEVSLAPVSHRFQSRCLVDGRQLN